jgi:SPP1 family predicted phage head-tail adaptor
MLRAGDLRHPIEFQKQVPQATRDEYGQQEMKWITQATAFAAIEQLTGNEQLIVQQQNSQATHAITTRVQRALPLTTSWRIKHRERFLFIASINNVGELDEEWRIVVGELKDG